MTPPFSAIISWRWALSPAVSSLSLMEPSPSVSSWESCSELTPSSSALKLPSPFVSFSLRMLCASFSSISSICFKNCVSRSPELLVAMLLLALAVLLVELLSELPSELVEESLSPNSFCTISSVLGFSCVLWVDELLKVDWSMPIWLLWDISLLICVCIFSRLAARAAASSVELSAPSPSVSNWAMASEPTPSSEAVTLPLESASLSERMLADSLLSISLMLP